MKINILYFILIFYLLLVTKVVNAIEFGTETGTLYENSYALLIGISDYKKPWSKLKYVKKDINKIEKKLQDIGFDVQIEYNNIDNRRQLNDILNNFIEKYGKDKKNRLFFYFSGHGHTRKISDGREKGYFILKKSESTEGRSFEKYAINMGRIKSFSEDIESNHALFIFDSCFAGTIFSKNKSAPPEKIQHIANLPVRQFITSGNKEQEVADDGIFVKYLIDGIDGAADSNNDTFVTGSELGIYLESNISSLTKKRQTPQHGKTSNAKLRQGDFIFKVKNKRNKEEIKKEIKDLEQEIKNNKKLKCSLMEKKIININKSLDSIENKNKKEKIDMRSNINELITYLGKCKISNYRYDCQCVD